MKAVLVILITCSFLQFSFGLNPEEINDKISKLEKNVQVCTITFLILVLIFNPHVLYIHLSAIFDQASWGWLG